MGGREEGLFAYLMFVCLSLQFCAFLPVCSSLSFSFSSTQSDSVLSLFILSLIQPVNVLFYSYFNLFSLSFISPSFSRHFIPFPSLLSHYPSCSLFPFSMSVIQPLSLLAHFGCECRFSFPRKGIVGPKTLLFHHF